MTFPTSDTIVIINIQLSGIKFMTFFISTSIYFIIKKKNRTCSITEFKCHRWQKSEYNKFQKLGHKDIFSYQLRNMKIRAFDMLRLLFLFTFSSAALVLQNYEAIPVFENKMSILVPIDNKHADSLVRCAMFCSFGCKTFNYNHNLFISCIF